jgi:hypothetical protein
MRKSSNNWVVVLAAGDGNRLRSVTTNGMGDAVPKQFCSLRGGPSLLLETLERAESVAARDRICVVVASRHRRWWGSMLSRIPSANVIVQPMNRGTANGILLPLLHIEARDPDARIVILPSDHYVRDELILVTALAPALSAAFVWRGLAAAHFFAVQLRDRHCCKRLAAAMRSRVWKPSENRLKIGSRSSSALSRWARSAQSLARLTPLRNS